MVREERVTSEYRSWFAVALWIVILLLTVPLARTLQGHVRSILGDTSFGYMVISIVSISSIYLIFRLNHTVEKLEPTRVIWILLCAIFLIAYTVSLWGNPIEAVHFVQYGILAGLLFIALSWRYSNKLIYIAIILATTIVGILDESLQWLIPNRVWGLSDIAVNTLASIIICIAIAKGIRPKLVTQSTDQKSTQLIFRLSITCISLLLLSFSNTPDTIAWYSERVSPLLFLSKNSHIMAEYGYRYNDETIGLFRSRFSPEELRKVDVERAIEAAGKLDTSPLLEDYKEFITRYSPITDPFLHELRVHLNRRDFYLKTAQQTQRYSDQEQRRRFRIAYFENKIVEKYFSNTLERSSFQLNQTDNELMSEKLIDRSYYNSPVSESLITLLSKRQLLILLALFLFGLIVLNFKFMSSTPTRLY